MNELLAAIPGSLPIKLALLALPMLPNLWGIRHAYKRRFQGREQIFWLLACVFIPVLGGLAYLALGWRRGCAAAEMRDET